MPSSTEHNHFTVPNGAIDKIDADTAEPVTTDHITTRYLNHLSPLMLEYCPSWRFEKVISVACALSLAV